MTIPKLFLLPLLAGLTATSSAAPRFASVTQVVNEVKLARPGVPVANAAVGHVVRGQTSLWTGRASRSERNVDSKPLTRICVNAIVSFEAGTRDR